MADQHVMDMRKLVGRNVARLRKEKGLTQEALAELSGFGQNYISALERGHRNPTIITLYEIAKPLASTPATLILPDAADEDQ